MTTSTRLTLEEFLAMPDIDERRLELIDGGGIRKEVTTMGARTPRALDWGRT